MHEKANIALQTFFYSLFFFICNIYPSFFFLEFDEDVIVFLFLTFFRPINRSRRYTFHFLFLVQFHQKPLFHKDSDGCDQI